MIEVVDNGNKILSLCFEIIYMLFRIFWLIFFVCIGFYNFYLILILWINGDIFGGIKYFYL